jgi:hypothetical protein
MKTREKKKEKEKVKLFFLFLFKIHFFMDIYYKHQQIHFLVHGHSSWSTFGVHLVWAKGTDD